MKYETLLVAMTLCACLLGVAPGCSDDKRSQGDGDDDGAGTDDSDTSDTDSMGSSRIIPDPGLEPDDCVVYDTDFDWDVVDCSTIAEGDDFYGQDPHYHFPYRQRDYTVAGDGTVFDNLTQLTWTECILGTDFDNDHECSHANLADLETWDTAQQMCGVIDYGGYDDWRVPEIWELWSVQDGRYSSPSMDPEAFTNISNRMLWSATPVKGSSPAANWTIYIEGSHLMGRSHTEECALLCVRGNVWPGASFEDQGEVVVDLSSGLMWQKCPYGLSGSQCEEGDSESHSLPEALAACEDLEHAGFDDWRLPDRHELLSLVDWGEVYPAIDTEFFPNTPSYEFLSSTRLALVVNDFFCVDFASGKSDRCTGTGSYGRVRCVRAGETPP